MPNLHQLLLVLFCGCLLLCPAVSLRLTQCMCVCVCVHFEMIKYCAIQIHFKNITSRSWGGFFFFFNFAQHKRMEVCTTYCDASAAVVVASTACGCQFGHALFHRSHKIINTFRSVVQSFIYLNSIVFNVFFFSFFLLFFWRMRGEPMIR